MNVLSLFDGMSCGQQALERIGIKVDNYFASEIDKYAIQVTMANYPNTKQLGSVINVNGYDLPKIDLLIGGSPCQSFSFAGKRKGMSTKDEQEILTLEHYLKLKSEGFEFEGQSYLFWEYMRLLNEVKPKYFLLENVMMGEKWEKVLSKAIGVNPIMINSSLVSAQNRKRLYWTNIGMQPMGLFGDLESIIEQPKDKNILLKDILQSDVDEKYFLSEKAIDKINRYNNSERSLNDNDKSLCLAAGYFKQGRDNQLIVHNTQKRDPNRPSIQKNKNAGGSGHLSRNDGKTYCLDTQNSNAVEIVAMRGRGEKGNIEQQLETNGTNKSNSLTTIQKDNLVRQVKQLSTNNKSNGGTQPYQQDRIYDINGISPALQSQLTNGSTMINTSRIRRLTPIECERLQTVADNYTNHVSDSQRYKMLGNGWTVDVIAHIFNYLKP
jgi:DNA (cytosine-5)-methyltransferase 3A